MVTQIPRRSADYHHIESKMTRIKIDFARSTLYLEHLRPVAKSLIDEQFHYQHQVTPGQLNIVDVMDHRIF